MTRTQTTSRRTERVRRDGNNFVNLHTYINVTCCNLMRRRYLGKGPLVAPMTFYERVASLFSPLCKLKQNTHSIPDGKKAQLTRDQTVVALVRNIPNRTGL